MKKIRILNYRKNFANNSSSSHSMLYIPPNHSAYGYTGYSDVGEYGGDNFTLSSVEDKNLYVLTQLAQHFSDMDEWMMRAIVSSFFPPEIMEQYNSGFYVDHESVWNFPLSFDENAIDPRFVTEFIEFLSQDSVLILGGRDNESHPLVEYSDELPNFKFPDIGTYKNTNKPKRPGLVCRKDVLTNTWTVFNRANGDKLRFTYDDPETLDSGLIVQGKMEAPELCDISITNKCNTNCNFCYRGSTETGVHAKLDDIERIITALSRLKVFELAIGGGEPTSHPNFIEILEYARDRHIVPNFTTRNYKLIQDPLWLKKVFDAGCGSFAVSVNNQQQMRLVSKVDEVVKKLTDQGYDDYGKKYNSVSAQIVMGTVSREEFAEMLRVACSSETNVTLLGYKQTMRGDEWSENVIPYDWWYEECVSNYPYFGKISIDTAIAEQYESLLKDSNVPRFTYHTREGLYSMFIDVVEMKAGSSSYHLDTLVPIFQNSKYMMDGQRAEELSRVFTQLPIV